MALAPGHMFKPLDKHLLDSYLRRKILGEQLPPDIIVEADVYGDDPNNLTDFSWVVVARYRMANPDWEWFFFASTVRKHSGASNSCRASRSMPLGRWKASQGIKTVLDSNLNVLGSKQSFCYMERSPSGGEEKTVWLMEEYSIPSLRRKPGASAINGSNKLDDWVICKIYLTPKARKIYVTHEDLPKIQPVNNAPPEAKKRRMEDPQTINSLSMHPSQDIVGHRQILRLPDNFLPPLVDMSGMPIDSCFSTQYAGEEPSIPTQDIAVDFFQIHQLADSTLSQSNPTVPVHVEMMEEGPSYVCRLANLDRSLKDIDAEGSIIAFSPEIMQASGEETEEIEKMASLLEREIIEAGGKETREIEKMATLLGGENMQAGGEETENMAASLGEENIQASGEETKEAVEMAALLGSLRDDISMPSIDDILH